AGFGFRALLSPSAEPARYCNTVRGPAPAQGVTACVCERGRCLFVCAGFCSADPLCSPCRAIHQLWQPRQFQAPAMPFPGGEEQHFPSWQVAGLPPSLLRAVLGSALPQPQATGLFLQPTSTCPEAELCSRLSGPRRVPAASPARCALPACPEAPAITGSRQAVAACPAGSGQGRGCCQAGRCCGAPKGPQAAFPAALPVASGGRWALWAPVTPVAHPQPRARLGLPRLASAPPCCHLARDVSTDMSWSFPSPQIATRCSYPSSAPSRGAAEWGMRVPGV
uniref:Uncharacterized protein n=1 Tax=Anser brachyrhynchus TaxID=132585 RepID=A0A8B9IAG1_9AVES